MSNEHPQNPKPPVSHEPLGIDAIQLTERQIELCNRLDRFYSHLETRPPGDPSAMLRGALYAMRIVHRRQNPDWMAQAAHSLRDIIYPFWRRSAPREQTLVAYGITGDIDRAAERIDVLYKFFSNLCHHNVEDAGRSPLVGGTRDQPVIITETLFESAVGVFETSLFESLRRQTDTHAEIDRLTTATEFDPHSLRELAGINDGARHYVLWKARPEWVDQLWNCDFLAAIKSVPEDVTTFTLSSPELHYLAVAASQEPEKVADIILQVPSSADRFNPEVITRFIWICSQLPAGPLARVVPKVCEERWPSLLQGFEVRSFEFGKMLETLARAGDWVSFLALTKLLLTVKRAVKDSAASTRLIDDPFALDRVSSLGVFERLSEIDDDFAISALSQMVNVLNEIISTGGTSEDKTFAIHDGLYLPDIDFFEIEACAGDHYLSYRQDILELVSAIIVLARRTFAAQGNDAASARALYHSIFGSLPDSQLTWRLRLLVLALAPTALADELRSAFFRVFETDHVGPLVWGTEYKKALRVCFKYLPPPVQRDFVSRLLLQPRESEKWHDHRPELLSSIHDELTPDELESAQRLFGDALMREFIPRPIVGPIQMHSIVPRAPVELETLSQMSISAIISKLKSDWTTARLDQLNTDWNDPHPLSSEGLAGLLKSDLVQRPQAYLDQAEQFFDRDSIDPHYTYSFLNGVEEALSNEGISCELDWTPLFRLMRGIMASHESLPFESGNRERGRARSWLANWDSLCRAVANLIVGLLRPKRKDGKILDLPRYRGDLLAVIAALLKHPSPDDKDEAFSGDETKTPKSDPLHVAINSVRGRGLEALLHFISSDSKSFPDDTKVRISHDVKQLFERCLEAEQTLAVAHLFGRSVPLIYSLDGDWARRQFDRIFPNEADSDHWFLAAWEGYLNTSLYQGLFEALHDRYRRAIALTPSDYSARRYNLDIDQALADHLALAYLHYPEFEFSSELFQAFWKQKNVARHKEFVSLIGRRAMSRDDAPAWRAANGVTKRKVKRFWSWALRYCADVEVLSEFGWWMIYPNGDIDLKWMANRIKETLAKTAGYLTWDYGLMRALGTLAEGAPTETLEILRHYMRIPPLPTSDHRVWLNVDDDIVSVFRTLHKNPSTKNATEKLINDLLPQGNGKFWRLSEVLNG